MYTYTIHSSNRSLPATKRLEELMYHESKLSISFINRLRVIYIYIYMYIYIYIYMFATDPCSGHKCRYIGSFKLI